MSTFAEKYENMSLVELLKAMDEIQQRKAEIDAISKEINKEYDFLRLNAIPTKADDEGIDKISVDGVGTMVLTADIYVSILATNKDAAYDFFDTIGKGDIIKATINSSTLKSVIKNMLQSGEEVPEDLIKVTPFTRASLKRK